MIGEDNGREFRGEIWKNRQRVGALCEYFNFTLPYPFAFSTPFSKSFACADPRRKNLILAWDYDVGKEMLKKETLFLLFLRGSIWGSKRRF